MIDTVLDVRNLQVQFPTDERLIKAVDGISFELKRGQTLGIVGESGSGKSVTSLAVMGLVPSPGKISGGEIWFEGVDAEGKNKEPINLLKLRSQKMQQYRGSQMAMIFQEPMSSLNPVYTIGFQLTEALRLHQNVSPAEARRSAIALLQEVKLIPSDEQLGERYIETRKRELFGKHKTDESVVDVRDREISQHINSYKLSMLDRYPHQLSGGQLQRVMIAMAISCNPALLIADEPTTALDVTVQATILDLLRELRDRRGMSMLFITHDLGIIAEIADVVAVMYQGKIVEYGSVWQIFSNPQHPYTKGLLACRPRLDQPLKYLPTVSDFMEVTTTSSGQVEIKEKPVDLNRIDSLSQTVEVNQPAEISSAAPLLCIRSLRVGFPEKGVFGRTKRYVWAVNNVSFDVYQGETLGLVGESGCGKTTLARTLLRLIEPTDGQVLFEGQNIFTLNDQQLRKLRREMQIVFQNPFSSLDPRIKIGDAVMEPLIIHGVSKNPRQRQERVAYLLDRVGLNPNLMNRYPHEFSGGQRQRVAIARALALNPKFIICDESVSALDVSVQAQVLNLLKELQAEFNLTYIFISHDLSVVKFMSDRIIVMNQGKIEEIGSAEALYREPEKEYTRQLIASIPTGSLERIQQQQAGRSALEN
ncbi:Nickel-transporting ATPase [Crinalium epipsammum PCC 9333]|uniref:Nickel-transporting ATPase n=1 Tax=Crinalium epipsammum PCC 9333 TaxID=1173022 RepID=K9W1Z5_9CYAN|nr:ABC transporter ATP-binding protein [Crinalium epipsammum]AFZ13772.1 Nickel-transporting ATPase [Crinalium epipsammum PCC 9333]